MTPPLDHILAPSAQASLIAGLFLAAGWWVVAFQGAKRDRKHRAERVRDVQRALFAEIRAYVAALRRDDLTEYGEEILQRIETEADYFPAIPTEANDAIFRAIISDIHVLPRDTIDPLVLYYSQLNAISAMIADLRMLDRASVATEQAAGLYRDFLAMKTEALILGEQAMAAIAGNMDGTGRTTRPSVNNPDAASSGQGWV
ncbi:MAG: hypothetical protein Q4G24_14545 [Paracoccus sp. (in: a-proteobacteria)]|uniref:hypothetical protein n=1 Tax=Paracoccus sp. TaxID=267 RepID=UPI0026E10BB4|nr:hypothetical protein [Paracoccus sp. (in: a-proteobacteria)]MDO5622676.1 hypothetical protein [Paracoccus sp. (in: a-proteobacteria)]